MSRSNYLQIRLSDIEKANYEQLASREGVTAAEWARRQLNDVVETKQAWDRYNEMKTAKVSS